MNYHTQHLQLTAEQRTTLLQREDTIRRGLKSFLEVGQALQDIHDGELYRETHPTFEDYCRDKWGIHRRTAYKLIEAAEAVGNLCPIGHILPANEAQTRPLTTLRNEDRNMDPELQRAAWSEAVYRADGGQPTARAVQEVVRQIEAGLDVTTEEARAKRFTQIEPFAPEENTPPLPTGRTFSLVLADPPWRYDQAHPWQRIENHYPTMSLDDIKALPVSGITDKNCILFLWTTAPKLVEAAEVMAAWGFTYKTNAVWRKEGPLGMGHYFRVDHEHILVGTKGSPGTPEPRNRTTSVVDARKLRHSQKPALFHEILEGMYPNATRIELFSRSPRHGWASWGNQSAGRASGEQPELDDLDLKKGEVLPLSTLSLPGLSEQAHA